MESLKQLFYDWEIQLLVILSFTLQLFLFFAGSLRRCITSGILRFLIWIAYLGADLIAIYALGYLSRYDDILNERHISRKNKSMALYWAPFLLIHLGGQDTITGFAMEDNSLWLRHLLNLVTQVVLALYVFWKSIGRQDVYLLVSGIFAFVAGIINYSGTVCVAIRSMSYVHGVFLARTLFDNSPLIEDMLGDLEKTLKVVRLELGMIYDDLYTKSLVLRTRSGIILRCISQISAIIAFVLFLTYNKHGYGKADIAITYSLFTGGFFLDIFAILFSMMSPWTWAWLKAQKCDKLSIFSWFILSSDAGWPEKQQRWPKSMGQYNFRCLLSTGYQPRTLSQRVMKAITNLIKLLGIEKKKVFWMSKLLDTEQVDVGMTMMEHVAKEVRVLHEELYLGEKHREPREWPRLGLLLERTQARLASDFGFTIIFLHKLTEVHLNRCPQHTNPDTETTTESSYLPTDQVEICRKLSNYMMYLLVANPSMLPLSTSAVATLESSQQPRAMDLLLIEESLEEFSVMLDKETLEEMIALWLRLLIFSAGKSRVEMHAAQLSRGGELITFTWLLMVHYGIGDSQTRRVQITNDNTGNSDVREANAMNVPAPNRRPTRA
ncbi:uncharacterized protein LOC102708570 [Oryza brachyantha]|uniref:uncharacterized protein LOC102708570 n=1 Tax=Oryza brachyantha TaxID=4533 RepID=UPI001ADC03BD|nr:uncharacterized protein LOC102708570 [Oryza brachyantha]